MCKKISIVNADGEVLPCPIKEEKRLNILEIAKSNPVVLSSVSVPRDEFLYCSWYRNIDDDTNYKWQKFIDIGYGGGSDENNLIKNELGALYKTNQNYRPTYNSTMNGDVDNFPFQNFQFGPVNTYHLTASLKARIGDYKDHPIDLVCDDDGIFYEWSHYSIAQFVEEWPPEMFK